MFRLCLDSIFQPHYEVSKASSYFIYDNLFEINRFELVFDSNYDEDKGYIEWCQAMGNKVYADDNDVFENDGEEVEVEIWLVKESRRRKGLIFCILLLFVD